MAIHFPKTEVVVTRRKQPAFRRWLYHGVLVTAFAAGGGALLVWPQWVALEGARTTLGIQQEREQELTERLDIARSAAGRLRLWEKEGRRVLLSAEAARYPVLAQAIGKREGVTVLKAEITQAKPGRWRGVTLEGTDPDDETSTAGEIRPQAVRLVLKGKFDGVYRTVSALTQQQQLFVPERWDLVPGAHGAGKGELWAEIWGTVFVVHQPDQETPTAPAASGPVARRVSEDGLSWEGAMAEDRG